MNTYEIINPSDPYTMLAPDDATACAASLLLCQGYGLHGIGRDFRMPPFLFDDPRPWFKEYMGMSIEDFLAANSLKVATALDTVLIGDSDDRATIDAAIAAMPAADARLKFVDDYADRKRTSMNNIGKRARQLAAAFRAQAASATKET